MRVVGDREDVERLGDRGVQAGRRAGHLADRPGSRRPRPRARRPGCRRPPRTTGRPGRQPDPRGDRPVGDRRRPPSDRPDRREERGRSRPRSREEAAVPVAGRGGRRRGSRRRGSRRWPPRRSGPARRDRAAGGAARPGRRRRLVLAQPEQLRGDVEAGRQVAGPSMDRRVAEPLAEASRLRAWPGCPGRSARA